jgi:hypothetical protein
MVICLTGDIALSSPYRFIEKIFPPSDEFLSNANESFKCDSPVTRRRCAACPTVLSGESLRSDDLERRSIVAVSDERKLVLISLSPTKGRDSITRSELKAQRRVRFATDNVFSTRLLASNQSGWEVFACASKQIVLPSGFTKK